MHYYYDNVIAVSLKLEARATDTLILLHDSHNKITV